MKALIRYESLPTQDQRHIQLYMEFLTRYVGNALQQVAMNNESLILRNPLCQSYEVDPKELARLLPSTVKVHTFRLGFVIYVDDIRIGKLSIRRLLKSLDYGIVGRFLPKKRFRTIFEELSRNPEASYYVFTDQVTKLEEAEG